MATGAAPTPADARGRRPASYLLDTHIWVWSVASPSELRPRLRRLIERSQDRCWISAASVWEVGLLIRRGRIRADTPKTWIERARARFPLRDAPVTAEVAIRAVDLPMHGDPADRLIAASALVYDLTLLTVDERLTSAEWLPTRSG